MGFLNRIKSFDVYRDIPKDLTEQTVTGACVSIVCTIAILWLFLSEFSAYLTITRTSEMFVDATKDDGAHHAMIQINLDITVPHIPCAVVSIDAQDVMGAHVVDVGGKLHKKRLDENLAPKVDDQGRPLPAESVNPREQMGEGCNIAGNMIVKKVPGNFHLSCHAHPELVYTFFGDRLMNVTHYINDLSFGESTDVFSEIEGANINPLKGVYRVAPLDPNDAQNGVSFEYYIKIVPTVYQKRNGKVYESYQFVANSNELAGRYRLPAVYFRYDLSPISVKYTEVSTPLAHFLVQICAIVGGVFTVLGLVNSMLHTTLRRVLKAQEGKLG